MFSKFDRQKEGIYNWCGTNILANKDQQISPTSEEEIIRLIKSNPQIKLRMIGNGLSYEPLNRLEDYSEGTSYLISMNNYTGIISETEYSITLKSGTSLQFVFDYLISKNKMLQSSPGVIGIQTIAGSIATGTHGQGMKQSTLCDSVLSLRIINGLGQIKTINKEDEDFGAFIMHYGSLGIVTEITFKIIPSVIYKCNKTSTNFDYLYKKFKKMNIESEYVKAWWFPEENDVHIWEVVNAKEEEIELYNKNNQNLTQIQDIGDTKLNPIIDQLKEKMSIETCDQQKRGRHFETIERFKNASNVVGNIYQIFCKGIPVSQINCEVAVPFDKIKLALQKLKSWYPNSKYKPHYPFILRCTGPSQAYLSGAYQKNVCWIGFVVYLASDGSFIKGSFEMLRELQELLAGLGGIPHFGKHFVKEVYNIKEILPMWEKFKEIRKREDPRGIFENQFLKDFFN